MTGTLYNEIIRLKKLKKPKCAIDIFTIAHNWGLLASIYTKVNPKMKLRLGDKTLGRTLSDFFQAVYDLRSLVEPKAFGISLENTTKRKSTYDKNDKVYKIYGMKEILGMELYFNGDYIDIRYVTRDGFKDNMIIWANSAYGANHTIKNESCKKLALVELETIMRKYVKSTICLMYQRYT